MPASAEEQSIKLSIQEQIFAVKEWQNSSKSRAISKLHFASCLFMYSYSCASKQKLDLAYLMS